MNFGFNQVTNWRIFAFDISQSGVFFNWRNPETRIEPSHLATEEVEINWKQSKNDLSEHLINVSTKSPSKTTLKRKYENDADWDFTKRLSEAGNVLGIPLLDHVIVTDRSFYSLKENLSF